MPAQQRLDARQQLRERERLGEIVVAAGLEAADAIVDRAEGAQDQHRRGQTRAPQLLNDRQPVDVRQHPVGDDQVELAREGAGEPLTAVGGVIDRVAALAQSFDENPRGLVSSSMSRMCTGRNVQQAGRPAQPQPGERRRLSPWR